VFAAGVTSIVLALIGYELLALKWINNWGDGIAWLIRIGLVVGGALLYLKNKDDDDEPSNTYFT
jgi:hypothetical protein